MHAFWETLIVGPFRYVCLMAEFVLVAGAWLGSWAWDEVVPQLRAAGRGAHPLTLSGLADKQGMPAGQQTHVRDIVDEIERNDLRDVIVVGHSYSGIPVGQAAERIGDRLARVVFVDSNVPTDGESFVSLWSEQGRARVESSIAEHGGFWVPLATADYDGQGLTDEQIARIVGGSTPHPGTTLTEPAAVESAQTRRPGHSRRHIGAHPLARYGRRVVKLTAVKVSG